jgi:hypothetical protein
MPNREALDMGEDGSGCLPGRSSPQNDFQLSRNGRAALAYCERLRWPVFPLAPRTKIPTQGSRGVHDATLKRDQILQWWTATPEANVGVACGQEAGFWVLDVDPRSGGEFSLDDLVADHGSLPDTVIQETGGGGLHYVFKWPTNGSVPSLSPGPGLDVKSKGGYIVVSPSIHPSGNPYCWQELCHPLSVPVADAPAWLLKVVCKPHKTGAARLGHSPEKWAELVAPVNEGRRNERLAQIAGLLFRRLPAPVAVVLARLWAMNRTVPPLPEIEIDRTLDSIAQLEARRLRGAR